MAMAVSEEYVPFNMNKHNLFIQEAVMEAKKCTMFQKHGCVIVHRTSIIARGHNSIDPYHYRKSSLHAEIAAINNMKKTRVNAENVIMYVVRINNGDLYEPNESIGTKNSKPCINCQKCITNHKVKKVYFTSISTNVKIQ
jgi:tRNA(Arg) A34 adenosine deaminase TadA